MRLFLALAPIVLTLFIAAIRQASAQTPPPLSGVVALTMSEAAARRGGTIPGYVRALVEDLAFGRLPDAGALPLPAAASDDVRAIAGLTSNVVITWLTPLTGDAGPGAPRFGANNDYLAYFGDGWQSVAGAPPQWQGSGTSGWLWVNHEYLSFFGQEPREGKAPKSQHLILATSWQQRGALDFDVANGSAWTPERVGVYVQLAKRELGGSWIHVLQDQKTKAWRFDRSRPAVRYDATSATRLRLTGQRLLSGLDHDDDGRPLPEGVVVGIMADCSGAQTAWGTILTAEENVQDYYGDLEACWSPHGELLEKRGFDAGADIAPVLAPSTSAEFGRSMRPEARHARDTVGYLSEIDPGVEPARPYAIGGDGRGHRKLGALGRGRFENASFAVDGDWRLLAGQPVVFYCGDDRYGGRVYKFVSSKPWTPAMSRAETRALLDEGRVLAAHFAGLDNATGTTLLATGSEPTAGWPGQGRWIELSIASPDVAPNAAALGKPQTTVGAALRDRSWNGIGGFPSDDHVRMALYTACQKIGVMETNRPEDVEWNPRDPSGKPRLYVSFTKMVAKVGLDQRGVRYPAAAHRVLACGRMDQTGSIFAIDEADPGAPGASRHFLYHVAWRGSIGPGAYAAACPDNLMIDRQGGLWFGTDGNPAVNGPADAFYYLDLDPRHRPGAAGVKLATYGRAFRIAAMPSDAEATGPCLASDERTFFMSVQHPGENVPSAWPKDRP
jgi:uncharacterized protein